MIRVLPYIYEITEITAKAKLVVSSRPKYHSAPYSSLLGLDS